MGVASHQEPEAADVSSRADGVERRRRRRRKSSLSRALASNGDRLTALLQILTVVGSAQALGAVHTPILLVVAVLGFAACILCYRARLVPDWRVPGPALIFFGLAAYTFMQALPMPMGLVATLAPQNAEVWAGVLAPFRESAPHWIPLTLDPGATLREGLKWLLYAAVFSTAAVAGFRRGAYWGPLVVFASGALVALSSLAHRLVGATTVYGFYEPIGEFAREKIGPLLNPNNLSGYLNVAVFCGFGLLVMRRPPVPRWLIALGVALQLGGLIEASSRGGLASFAVGLLLLGPMLAWARSRGDASLADKGTVRAVVLGVVAGGVLLAALALARTTTSPFGDHNIEKIKLLSWIGPLLRDHWLFGIGRGAFESVFPAFKVGQGNVIFTHPENFLAQWASEWGLPVSVLAFGALIHALRPKALGFGEQAVAVGVLTGLCVLAAQNLVDLGLEVPAIPIAVATALGSCWGAARVAEARHVERDVERWPVRFAWVVGVLCVLGLGSVARWGMRPVGDEREAINQAIEAADFRDAAVRGALRADLRAAMLRHPAEPYFPRMGAYVAWRGGDQSPLPWLDRALERGLTSGRSHYLLAHVLASQRRKSQALLQARLALRYDAMLAGRVAPLVLSLDPDARQLLGVIPDNFEARVFIEALLRLMARQEQAALRGEFLELALERFPDLPEPRVALATDLLASMEGKRWLERCADERRAACAELVQKLASRVAQLRPNSSEAVELRAGLLLATGKQAEAERLLASECDRFHNNRRCKKLRLSAATKARSEAGVADATRALIATGCETPVACAESFDGLGDTMTAAGKFELARSHYERAAREDPSAERWLKLGNAASRAGAHLEAADAFARVLRERGSDQGLQQRISEERRRAVARQLASPTP